MGNHLLLHLLISPCSDPAFEKAPLLHVMAILVATIKHSLSEESSARCSTAASLYMWELVICGAQLG